MCFGNSTECIFNGWNFWPYGQEAIKFPLKYQIISVDIGCYEYCVGRYAVVFKGSTKWIVRKTYQDVEDWVYKYYVFAFPVLASSLCTKRIVGCL